MLYCCFSNMLHFIQMFMLKEFYQNNPFSIGTYFADKNLDMSGIESMKNSTGYFQKL